MSVETKLAAKLLATSGVTALVGNRVDPVVVQATTTFPSLTYRRLTGRREYTLAGLGPATITDEVMCWAANYEDARTLAEAVAVACDGYGTETVGDIAIASVDFGEDTYAAELNAYGCPVQVTMVVY